ncbi:unnamed protein product [Trichobilharzia szidati]|nr:unnamed protein product [Trichobilharzia szidati]
MPKGNKLEKRFLRVRDETIALSAQLMSLCLRSKITSGNALHVLEELQSIASEIITLQKDYSFVSKLRKSVESRKISIERLTSSLECYVPGEYAVHWFGEYGFGLRALVQIGWGDELLNIPRKDIFCVDCSTEDLKDFIRNDSLASNMENIALSLCVLGELYEGENSKWWDYISSLPSDYPTFVYMDAADIRHLKGSPVLEKVASNYLFICRQYAYFCCQFRENQKFSGIPNFVFCFDDYRWAVSTVMSRSNYIPHRNGTDKIMCLIPVWDLMNHKSDYITSHYDLEMDALVFSTMEAYEPGDQCFSVIWYMV